MSTLRDPGLEPSLLSPFGFLLTAELHPLVQADFVYGINSQIGVSTTANSATVDTSSSRLRLQSGTDAAGSAIFNTRRPAKYRHRRQLGGERGHSWHDRHQRDIYLEGNYIDDSSASR